MRKMGRKYSQVKAHIRIKSKKKKEKSTIEKFLDPKSLKKALK